jgi:hypothetical protein
MKTSTILGLTNSTFFDTRLDRSFLDKAKPSARRGRKAAGLLKEDGRAAEG